MPFIKLIRFTIHEKSKHTNLQKTQKLTKDTETWVHMPNEIEKETFLAPGFLQTYPPHNNNAPQVIAHPRFLRSRPVLRPSPLWCPVWPFPPSSPGCFLIQMGGWVGRGFGGGRVQVQVWGGGGVLFGWWGGRICSTPFDSLAHAPSSQGHFAFGGGSPITHRKRKGKSKWNTNQWTVIRCWMEVKMKY